MFEYENELHTYDLYPKIVPVGRKVRFTLRAMDPDIFYNAPVHLDLIAINGAFEKIAQPLVESIETTPLEDPQNGFTFDLTLPSEQEYRIQIRFDDPEVKRVKAYIPLYALEDDLLSRTPLVGDMHAHSYFSDGNEGPAFIAAHYRQNGFDFATLTDHRRMAPSLRAIKAYEGLDMPFRIYRGEEVHPNKSKTHIVNFGGEISANEFALADKTEKNWRNTDPSPEWEEELKNVEDSLTDVPEDVNKTEVARSIITTRKIKEGGGMAILAHPHWNYPVRNVSDQLTRYYLKLGIFDAVEFVGGLSWADNFTQISLYHDLREHGQFVPLVGSSDAHWVLKSKKDRQDHFTEERTIVFAKENTRDSIIEAVKGLYSTAMIKYVNEHPFFAGGGYRLEQYSLFLYKNYFSLRDELYFEEGRLMHEYIAGTPGAKERLENTFRENAYFENKYFCRDGIK